MNADELNKTEVAAQEPSVSLAEELAAERKKREGLEQRVNELIAEAERSKAQVEEAQRATTIRTELQRLGVAKIDLAFKAVKDDLKKSSAEEVRSYLTQFVAENPELMPARMSGGSGAVSGAKGPAAASIDLDKIRPGMSSEDLDRVRREIARVASQTLRGGW